MRHESFGSPVGTSWLRKDHDVKKADEGETDTKAPAPGRPTPADATRTVAVDPESES